MDVIQRTCNGYQDRLDDDHAHTKADEAAGEVQRMGTPGYIGSPTYHNLMRYIMRNAAAADEAEVA